MVHRLHFLKLKTSPFENLMGRLLNLLLFLKSLAYTSTTLHWEYSIVEDSNANLGLFSELSKILPLGRLSALNFHFFLHILIFLREINEGSFFLFWIFKLKQPFFNQDCRTIIDYGKILEFQLQTVKSALLSLTRVNKINVRHSAHRLIFF